MSARATHALLAILVAVGAPASVMLGCDDTSERRTKAILASRGANSAEAAQGAAELEKMLEKAPKDALAAYALGAYDRRHGKEEDAKRLFARVIDAAPNSEEAEHARDDLTAMAASPPAASASHRAVAVAPLASTAIAPFHGIPAASVGSAAASSSASLGACELVSTAASTTVCHRFSLGLDVASAAGSVTRVSFERDKRELFDGTTHHLYRGFVGQTPDGIEVGMPAESASAKLGPPTTRRLPATSRVADDGSVAVEVDDYPKKGLSLEIDLTRQGRVVGAISVPDADGLPMPAKKESKP